MIVLFFLGLFQYWFTAMPLSPVRTYVYASFAKFTCSIFCFVILCIWLLQINWIGLEIGDGDVSIVMKFRRDHLQCQIDVKVRKIQYMWKYLGNSKITR